MELVSMIALMVFHILLPIMLFIALYLSFLRFRGLFQSSCLGSREVGLLIVGSFVGTFSTLPVLISPSYLLALNFGGAIVPIVLAFYFIHKKQINAPCAFSGILLVSITAFLATKYKPGVGVYSEFPWYFLPSLMGILCALLIYRRRATQGAPYAYAITTLGVLVGADLWRLARFFSEPRFAGSIGGAGIYDMVFISGLLAMLMVFVFSAKELRKLPVQHTEQELGELQVNEYLSSARTQVYNNPKLATHFAYKAAMEKATATGEKLGMSKKEFIAKLSPIENYNLRMLSQETCRENIEPYDAKRAVKAAHYLRDVFREKEKSVYASPNQRVCAYLIDLFIVMLLFIGGSYMLHLYGIEWFWYIFSLPALITLILLFLWLCPVQALYFLCFEILWATSPGKALLGLRVKNDDLTKLDGMGAFTRNVVRFLDLLLLYVPSVTMLYITEKRQRIGDWIGKTVVVSRARVPS